MQISSSVCLTPLLCWLGSSCSSRRPHAHMHVTQTFSDQDICLRGFVLVTAGTPPRSPGARLAPTTWWSPPECSPPSTRFVLCAFVCEWGGALG
jgi:hypothetical protein